MRLGMIQALTASLYRYTEITSPIIAAANAKNGSRSVPKKGRWFVLVAASPAESSRNMGARQSNFAVMIPTMVEQPVATKVVGKIAAGSMDSWSARSPMMPVGNKANPLVLMARNRTMALVAVPCCLLSLFNSAIALMPNGVAAFPNPRALAAKFITIAPMAGWSSGMSGKRRTRTGRIKRAINARPPDSSMIFSSPRNRAM